MSKTYFNHTSKLEITKRKLVPNCTLAIQRVGDSFWYGVTICSKYDNFCKATGRKIAEQRLIEGFGVMKVPEIIKNLNEKQSYLAQLYNLTYSVITKTRRWKGRITRFNMEGLKLKESNSQNKEKEGKGEAKIRELFRDNRA